MKKVWRGEKKPAQIDLTINSVKLDKTCGCVQLKVEREKRAKCTKLV